MGDSFLYARNGCDSDAEGTCSVRDLSVIHASGMRGTKVLVRATFAKRASLLVTHASGVRRMFVEYCTVFARMRRRARYVSDSSVIVSD